MKKVFAILMTLLLVVSFAACTKTEEEPTRSQEELVAEANEAAKSLVEYKEALDAQLLLVNSADNNDKFFDLAGMSAVGAQFDTLLAQLNNDTSLITDGETAAAAAEQVAAIAEKVNTAAVKYYDQFVIAYPDAALTKIHCLTVFMSGEPSSFFAATFNDAEGAETTVYSVSSFTAATPVEVLASIAANLFAEAPVSSRDAKKDGNFNIDLDAVKAAAAPATDATEENAQAEETEAVVESTDAATEVTEATVEATEAETEATEVVAASTDAATEAAAEVTEAAETVAEVTEAATEVAA